MQVLLEATQTLFAQAIRPDMTGRTDSDTSSVHGKPAGKAAMFAEEVMNPPSKHAPQEENTRVDEDERDAIHRRWANRGAGAYATARGGGNPFASSSDNILQSTRERVAAQSARLKQEQTTARNREKAARERARRAAQTAAAQTAEDDARREAQREEARRNIAERRAQLEAEAWRARDAEARARVAAAKGHRHAEPEVDLRKKQQQHDEAEPTGGGSAGDSAGGVHSSAFHADASSSGHGGPKTPESAIERALRCGLHDVHGALGVRAGCQGTALHKAWRRACLEVHPDRNFGNEADAAKAQQIVNAAHDLLQDPAKLRAHLQAQREEAAKARYAAAGARNAQTHGGHSAPKSARPSARPGSRARGDPRRQTAASTARGNKPSSSPGRGGRGASRGGGPRQPPRSPPPPFSQHV